MNIQISEQKCSENGAASISVQTARKDYAFISKSRLIFWAKIAIAILALSILGKSIKIESFGQLFSNARWHYLLIAFLIIVPNLMIQVWKWRYLLRLANSSISWETAFKSFIVGYPLGFVTPGRLGEIGRALYVKEISPGKTLRLFALDKGMNLVVTLFPGGIGVFSLIQHDLIAKNPLPFLMTVALTGTSLMYFVGFSTIVKRWIGRFIKIYDYNTRNNLALIAFSLIFYVIFLGQFVILISNFVTTQMLPASAAAAAVFFTKTILPISFGDLGIREGAAVFYFGKIALSPSVALNASLLLFLFNVGIPALIGLPVLFKTKKEFP
ncbi:MAG: lysylphosphatidylglycerol synthase transmembrane domain-containing protein [bacterium]